MEFKYDIDDEVKFTYENQGYCAKIYDRKLISGYPVYDLKLLSNKDNAIWLNDEKGRAYPALSLLNMPECCLFPNNYACFGLDCNHFILSTELPKCCTINNYDHGCIDPYKIELNCDTSLYKKVQVINKFGLLEKNVEKG